MKNNLAELYGNIDIYLFDQLLKGRFDQSKKVLDVGCGGGRNLFYFLRNGYDVFGVDRAAESVERVRQLSFLLAPENPLTNFTVSSAEDMEFSNDSFDLVVCSAVLHFAKDDKQFGAMMRSMFRVLKPGGHFFSRLASDIGIENRVNPVGNGRYLLPDGTERYLVNEEMLLKYTTELGELRATEDYQRAK